MPGDDTMSLFYLRVFLSVEWKTRELLLLLRQYLQAIVHSLLLSHMNSHTHGVATSSRMRRGMISGSTKVSLYTLKTESWKHYMERIFQICSRFSDSKT